MSFQHLADILLDFTQGYFGEAVNYNYMEGGSVNIKAIFSVQWIEVNGVSAQSMTCEINKNDLSRDPKKGDTITRGAKTYKVDVSQPQGDGNLLTLILKD